jgi:hypothetical protein
MPTLVLPPRYTEDTQAMWRAAIAAGWDVERLPGWRATENLAGKDVVLYGEPLFSNVVAGSLGIALLDSPPNWLTELPDEYRRRWVRASTLKEARALNERAFIKPAIDKCFPAGVYSSGPSASELLDDSMSVLIAEPVRWEVEYRCFVLQRRVLTWSPYFRDGQLTRAEDGSWPAPVVEMENAIRFAQLVLKDGRVRLPNAAVMDVGIIDGRGWAVVETNAAWGSGIYGCDPHEVLKVVQRSCVRRDRLSADDAKWSVR